MNVDVKAQERIAELEELLNDRVVLIDIQAEQIAELEARVRALQGQLRILRLDRRYEVGVA